MSSAVEIAQVSTEPASTNGLKRMQLGDLEQGQDSKRQRTSPGKRSPTATEEIIQPRETLAQTESTVEEKAQDKRESRQRIGVKDEKQRNKRLFGALLGNLNQPSDRVSRRRTEIEQRRKAELQKQDDERLEDRQNRLERRLLQRKKEQITYDEQTMKTRHKNLLNSANFLQTEAEPKMYYRPWELLPDEEDRIEDQLKEAQAQIDTERDAWEDEKERRLASLTESSIGKTDDSPPNGEEEKIPLKGDDRSAPEDVVLVADQQILPEFTASADAPKHLEVSDPNPSSTDDVKAVNGASDHQPVAQESENNKADEANETQKDVEDEGDHVEEGDEDTVIY